MLSSTPRAPSIADSSNGLLIACLGRRDGAVVAAGLTDAHQRRAGVGEDHLDVGEVGVDETGGRDQVGDAGDTLQQHLVGHLECVEHAGLLVGDAEQPVVGDDDQRVDLLLEALHAGVGLNRTPPTLEPERPGDDTDRERPGVAGDLGDHGRGACAGAAALAGGDEHHVGTLDHLFDLVAGALSAA